MAFVTFPYVSRVLGVEHIGLVNFVDNTIGYFLLFATMGVNLLGVREIAAVKEQPDERSRVFSRILGQNLLSTLVVLLIYLIIVSTVPILSQYASLFYMGAAKIVCTAFLVEWFFSGIENFRYITLRSLAIKVLYVIAVFVFVRNQEDYRLYFLLTISTVVVNALINTIYVRRFVKIRLGELFSLLYLKRCCILGAFFIMTSMYITFNVMCLGFYTDNTQVGYYTTAFKLYTVVLGLFSSFTSVMIPRMSALISAGEEERFQKLVSKSFRAMFTFSIPMIICAAILAPQIIYVLSGTGYEGAILPMRIIMPAALFVGISQILSMQILTPMKQDKVLFVASAIGASVCLIINITVVPMLQSVGSAIVLLCSEMAVSTTYMVWVSRKRIATIPLQNIGRQVAFALPCAAICWACQHFLENPFVILGVAFPLALSIWGSCKYIVDRKFI